MLNQQERIHLIINLLSITEQKTKTLKIKLTILKFSSFSTIPTIRLKLTINLTARNIRIAKQPFNKNKPNY